MTKPILYGADWCAYCVALAKKLDYMGVAYEHRDVDMPGVREEMNAKTNGNQTIPVLFVGETYKINPNDQEVRELVK